MKFSYLPQYVYMHLIILLFIIFASPLQAKDLEVTEYEIKAGFIYRFLLFVKWPDQNDVVNLSDEDETIVIGIVGKDPFKNYFTSVENKIVPTINKRLEIRRFDSFSDDPEIKKCQVLYISSSERKNLGSIFSTLNNAPILTISEVNNFCENGGIINLVTIGDRIRYEVNISKAKRLGFIMNSSFLKAAIRVTEDDDP
jgi:hypothetical protein